MGPGKKKYGEFLAVCCASAQNCIKIHKSEFLYPANCIKEPDNRGFFAYPCKKSTSATGSQATL
jgi:hypothetical protein